MVQQKGKHRRESAGWAAGSSARAMLFDTMGLRVAGSGQQDPDKEAAAAALGADSKQVSSRGEGGECRWLAGGGRVAYCIATGC